MPDARLSLAREVDREFFARELESFVPDRVFDAHAHLWLAEAVDWPAAPFPARVGIAEHQQLCEDLHPGRRTAGYFLPGFSAAHKDLIPASNEWLAQQVATRSDCRGAFFVQPGDDPDWVQAEVRRLKLHALKCYHTMAASPSTWEAEVDEFLPEPLVRLADQEGWCITLHLVRSRAVADPKNIDWITRTCRRFPNMRLILAHSARGFQPAHNLAGLPHLAGLDNLYFDTSANCEPIAHQAIIRTFGHERLLYGSDLPVSHFRGRAVGIGDSFVWLDESSPVWGDKHAQVSPVLVGLEHLRSLKWACWSERLGDAAVEDIFWNNAARLFGVAARE
ncbi:MAG: amidohydrolase [Pirellulales bacterium]|nr:amidohydrolase [Pirellulales bacterium]